MKTLKHLQERIKADLKQQFTVIKNAAGNERLYVFALGRVEDISGQYFAVGHTLEQIDKQLCEKASTHYSDFWWAAELSYGAEHGSISYAELDEVLDDCNDEDEEERLRIEYDTMIIDSLMALKAEGLFETEIPEFCAYIQYQDEAVFLEEDSFNQIFPERDHKAFAAKYNKSSESLTVKLIKQYRLGKA